MARMSNGTVKFQTTADAAPDWGLAPMAVPNEKRGIAPLQQDTTDWAPAGPGWHDSSWLLRQGLEVTELRSAHLLEGMLRALPTQSPPTASALHAPA